MSIYIKEDENISKIEKQIVNYDLSNAIKYSKLLIGILNNNTINKDLTKIELSIIKIYLKNNPIKKVINNNISEPLFIISEGYLTGGHTRLMEQLGTMLDGNCNLMLTRKTNSKVISRLLNYFKKIEKPTLSENKTIYINSMFKIITKYNKVILNIHPDDIETVIACYIAKQKNKELEIYFINHADHLSTYGASVANIWFEISYRGAILDNFKGVTCKKSFIGIPINKPMNEYFYKLNYPKTNSKINFLTAASGYKYKPYQNKSILPLLDTLLNLNKENTVTIIGIKNKDNLFNLLKRKYNGRVFIYDSIDYELYLKITNSSDCYIDSYPIPGGTAFVEQFINKKPCIGIKTKFFGYTPIEKIKKNNISDVIDSLHKPIDSIQLDKLQKETYLIHGYENVKKRFLNTLNYNQLYKMPDGIYKKEHIEEYTEIKYYAKERDQIYLMDKEIFYNILFNRNL